MEKELYEIKLPLYSVSAITKSEAMEWVPKSAQPLIAPIATKQLGMLSPKPYRILQNVCSISSCVHNNAAIDNSGILWTWGATTMAQIGDNVFSNDSPQNVNYLPKQWMENATFVSAGAWHTMCITEKNQLWGWGKNSSGELGVGDFVDRAEPIFIMDDVEFVCACDTRTFAIKKDKSLWGWGLNSNGHFFSAPECCSNPIHLMNAVQYVSAGEDVVMVIKEDNTLWGWGLNTSGIIYKALPHRRCDPTLLMSNIRSVSVPSSYGDSYCLAITKNNDLYSLGNGDDAGSMVTWKQRLEIGKCPIKVMEGVEEISTGHGFTFIQLVDTRLFAIGRNELGQCGIGKSTKILKNPAFILSNVISSSGGHFHGMGLQSSGDLWIWGGDYGQSQPPRKMKG